ncbi:SH3 domain-containing protein [Arenibaculum pallidiluteum]|uniref:SH3 domain-containing protein n=1 Tax=Arenibaculum pallidiluteum TaxID=2812559 RepID=UPI001B3B803A|nr:SH3 domain-containing protein [Arenibaculum pallidiluteum]
MPTRIALAATLILGLFAAPAALGAGDGAGASAIKRSGLPLPRFVTLRSAEVNVRTGPGTQYPVEWVFVRKDLPVEITTEFDTWRRIRDAEGTEGWVHQSMLSGKRGVVVTGQVRSLRRSPGATAAVVARVEPGVMGTLRKCQDQWCEVDLEGYRGWLNRAEFWGVYPDEAVDD